MRYLILFFALLVFNSCDYFSFKRKNDFKEINPELDTTSVDLPPSLGRCNSLIDKEQKTICFYEEVSIAFEKSLEEQDIKVKRSLDETVYVIIRIDAIGTVSLRSIEASETLYAEIPDFKKMIEKAINDLPKVVAAVKKEVPVTTEYKLPIKIALKN